MSAAASSTRGATPMRVLVVDDDRRVRELLEVALSSSGFGVITAADGDEALLRAQRERPDLVLLDVRLPKRSGLEVCDLLRNDPTDPGIPIVLLSAAAESDHRLQGYLRGADDFLAKPFSPRELIARIRRLLTRAAETRAAQQRAHTLERELSSVRREARRAGEEARREELLREVARGSGSELLRLLDLDALLARLLEMSYAAMHPAGVAALVVEPSHGELKPRAILGDRFARLRGTRIALNGELASLLAGLARPLRLVDLERRPGLAPELEPMLRGGWDLLAPLVSTEGLEAVLLFQDSGDPAAGTRAELERLGVLCGVAAVALGNARTVRVQAEGLLAVLAEGVYRPVEAARPLAEAHVLLLRASRALELPPSERERASWAIEMGGWALSEHGVCAFEALVSRDPSGLVAGVRRTIETAHHPPSHDAAEAPEFLRAALLARALLEYQDARSRGADAAEALGRAAARVADRDPLVTETLLTLDTEPFAASPDVGEPPTSS